MQLHFEILMTHRLTQPEFKHPLHIYKDRTMHAYLYVHVTLPDENLKASKQT